LLAQHTAQCVLKRARRGKSVRVPLSTDQEKRSQDGVSLTTVQQLASEQGSSRDRAQIHQRPGRAKPNTKHTRLEKSPLVLAADGDQVAAAQEGLPSQEYPCVLTLTHICCE